MLFFLLLAGFAGGVHGGQANASYHAVVMDIKDGLRQILPTGDREIAINALLRSAEAATRIDPFINETLGQVLDLLLEHVNYTNGLLEEYSRWVMSITHEAEFCNAMDMTELQAAEAIVIDKLTIHGACRTVHEYTWHQMNNSRTALTDFMTTEIHGNLGGSTLSATCVKPGTEQSIETWTQRVQAAEEWIESARSEWETLKYDYSNWTQAEVSNTTQCNADQQVFETSVCEYIAEYKAACQARETCWETRVQNSTTLTVLTRIQTHNLDVKHNLRMIDYVICLIGLMRQDRANEAQTECADVLEKNLEENYPSLEVNLTYIPVEDDCNPGRLNASARYYPFDNFYQANFSTFIINQLLAASANCPVEP